VYQHVLRSTAWLLNEQEESHGSGVLVDLERRLVMTNYHVVGSAREVTVFFSAYDGNGELITDPGVYTENFPVLREAGIAMVGRVVARWKRKDLAIVQLPQLPVEAQAVPLAAHSVQPGETVHSVGNSGARKQRCLWRYTRGVVRSTYLCPEEGIYFLESDSPINKGDSGGPMVSDRGELVGLVTQYRTDARLVSQAIELREVRSLLDWYFGQGLDGGDGLAQISHGR
jgi:S1-C subfamily serine protease